MKDPLKVGICPNASTGSRIALDGKDITAHVTAFSVDSAVNKLTSVTLTLTNVDIATLMGDS